MIILCFFSLPRAISHLGLLLSGRQKLKSDSGCPLIYVPKLPLQRISLIRRLNKWFCGLVIFIICWLNRIHIAHGHGFAPSSFVLTAQKFGAALSLVADIHGATLEEAIYAGRLASDDEVVKVYKKDEKSVLNQSEWLIFVSSAMRKYYEDLAQDTFVKASVIPCATETSFEIDERRRAFLRSKFGLENRIVFCYVGSAAPYQMIGEMVRLFDRITKYIPKAFFLLFSHHQDVFLSYMQEVAINPSRYRVTAVDHNEIFDYLQMGDIGFLLRENSIVNRVASPTKFAEYCLSGLPVITTAYVGDFSAMVKDQKLGYVLDLPSLSVDMNLVNFVMDVQQNRSIYAKRCANFAKENFSWDHYGSVLSDIYLRVEQN